MRKNLLQNEKSLSPSMPLQNALGLPSHWKATSLENVATLQRGKDLPQSQRDQGSYPVIGSNGIVGYHAEFAARGPGVLVGRSGSVGKVTWTKDDYWPLNTTLWVKDFHGNYPKFVYYLLIHVDLGKYTAGVSVPTLNRNSVHPLEVIVPPFNEQGKIAFTLDTVQKAKEARQYELTLERESKAALMQHLFTHGTRSEPLKETEIGEIPESWEIIKISDLLNRKVLDEIQDGNHGERHPKQKDFQEHGIPFITADCIREGHILFKKLKYINNEWLHKLRVGFSKPGDILITHKGTMGETCIVGNRFDTIILSPQVTYYRVRDFEKIDPEYLFMVFQSHMFKKQLDAFASSQSTRSYVGITNQKRIKIVIPIISEQRYIAEILRSCNEKISALEQEITLLDELFRAMLEELMTGRLSAVALIDESKKL